MRKYELTYLVSDEVQESDLNKVTGKVAGLIGELGGKVDKEDIWGRRKLIYPIQKQDFATYITLFFGLPAEKAIEFEKDLRHIGGIIRQLMIVREYGEEGMTLSTEEITETADIEKVIGGEKSFEAVAGTTGDSRDLMAKREKEVEESDQKLEESVKEAVETVEPAETPSEGEPAEQPEEPHSAEASRDEEEEAPVKPKTKKETKKKAAAETTDEETEIVKPKTKAKKNNTDEAERLSKLNDELDDILKDEL